MSAEMAMRCEDVAPYLSAFGDGELAEPLRSEVAEHVATCDACTATLARYAQIDALFAALPRSAPPPELLDQILAEVAAEDEQAERRQAMRAAWSIETLKRKFTELESPLAEGLSHTRVRSSHRSRWISVAIPAIAALLLISVTLVTFRWLPSKDQILPTNQATSTPAPSSQTLQSTHDLVSAIQAQLPFKAVLPTYLPDGASLADVKLGPQRDSDISEHYLDVYWTISAPALTIHLHEASTAGGLPSYTDLPATAPLTWQIGNTPWRQVRVNDAPKNMAIAQRRAGVAIALDISMPINSSQAAIGQAVLRMVSLSMDSRYLAMPTAPDEKSARILPLPIEDMVAHYSAVALNSDGAIAWREEVYEAPCASTADSCQISKAYSLGRSSAVLYTDIASNQRLLQLDWTQSTYSWQPLIPSVQGDDLESTSLPKLFYLANTYLSTGILWNMGQITYRGERVYNLLWTSAPNQTHIYVSTKTHQVVAMSVDSRAKIQAGGPIAGTGAFSCMRYTMLEYIAPNATTDAALAQNIPANFTESQEQQQSFSC